MSYATYQRITRGWHLAEITPRLLVRLTYHYLLPSARRDPKFKQARFAAYRAAIRYWRADYDVFKSLT